MEGAPAFWPWTEVVRKARLLDRLEPEIAAVLGIARDRRGLPFAFADSSSARFRVADAVASCLCDAARERPLMIALDDLHSADDASLRLLEFLAPDLSTTPLLVVATHREGETGPALARALRELARFARVETLAGLPPPEMGEYTRLSRGDEPSEEVLRFLVAKTEGNPFFLGEMIRWLERAGDPPTPPPGFPESVREVIGRSLERLSRSCLRLLETAAAMGRGFDLELLSRATRVRGAVPLLEEARKGSVVEEAEAGRFRFRHELLRDVVCERTPPTRRADVHRRIALTLEHLTANDPEARLDELAHHFSLAAEGEPGLTEHAVGYGRRAAEQALAGAAWEHASLHAERALHFLSGGEPRRLELLLLLGEAERRAGRPQRAQTAFREAARLARADGDSDKLGEAALGFAGLWSEAGSADPEVRDLLEDAERRLPAADGALRARLLGRLSQELYYDPAGRSRGEGLSREALAMAARVSDPATRLHALHSRHAAMAAPGNLDERLELATEMVAVADRIGDREMSLQGRYWRFTDLLESARTEELEAELAAYTRLAETLRQPLYLSRVLLRRGMLAQLAGRFEEAERLAREALMLGGRAGNRTTELLFTILFWTIRHLQGRHEEIERSVAGLLDRADAFPAARCALALVHAELGRRDDAAVALERFAEGGFAALPRDAFWLLGMALLAEVALDLGASTQARGLYDLLLPHSGRVVVAGRAAAACWGSLDRLLGSLAALFGDREAARGHLERAVELDRRIGSRPWLAMSRFALADVLSAAGDEGRALDLSALALGAARDLGMERLAARAVAWTSNAARESAGEGASSPATHVFRRDGEFWTLSFAGVTRRLRHRSGFPYVAHLLANPGVEVHVMQLAGRGELAPGGGDAGEQLDASAMAQYRARLASLQGDRAEAEREGDGARAGILRTEIERIAAELASAVGLYGRPRRGPSVAERARKAVTNAVRRAVAGVRREHPALGRHLVNTLRTGAFCAYQPEAPIDWRL